MDWFEGKQSQEIMFLRPQSECPKSLSCRFSLEQFLGNVWLYIDIMDTSNQLNNPLGYGHPSQKIPHSKSLAV